MSLLDSLMIIVNEAAPNWWCEPDGNCFSCFDLCHCVARVTARGCSVQVVSWVGRHDRMWSMDVSDPGFVDWFTDMVRELSMGWVSP